MTIRWTADNDFDNFNGSVPMRTQFLLDTQLLNVWCVFECVSDSIREKKTQHTHFAAIRNETYQYGQHCKRRLGVRARK